MSNISKSPERHTFQADNYVNRCEEEGKEPSKSYIKMYEQYNIDKLEREANPEWQENNMEYDLRSTPWICDKVKESKVYAQNLYASMCNNEFQRNDMMPILKRESWGCSWRHAGGIIADMQEQGDYIDWYCSGIGNSEDGYGLAGNKPEQGAYVPEGVVTEEIELDLNQLGWRPVPYTDEEL